MKRESSPIRTCLGCGKRRNKFELIRICYFEGKLFIDDKMVLPGRGCYLCADLECLGKMRKNRKIFNALKIDKTVSVEEIYANLVEKLKNRSI